MGISDRRWSSQRATHVRWDQTFMRRRCWSGTEALVSADALTGLSLRHRVAVVGRILAGDVMLQLAFDVAQQGGRAKAEKIRL